MADPVYGFASQDEFRKAMAVIRWGMARMAAGDSEDTRYASPAVAVLVKANSVLTGDDGPAPSEAGVYLCSPVYRDLRQTNPAAADAWVEYGPAANHYCEAFGPNQEPLVVGRRYTGRAAGNSEVTPFRPRVLVGSTAGVTAVEARTSAANTGRQWTAAKLVAYNDPLPPNLGGGAAPGEAVLVQPKYGAAFTSGGIAFPAHTLDGGNDYPLSHEISPDTATGKRRFYVLPVGWEVCNPSDKKLYRI